MSNESKYQKNEQAHSTFPMSSEKKNKKCGVHGYQKYRKSDDQDVKINQKIGYLHNISNNMFQTSVVQNHLKTKSRQR